MADTPAMPPSARRPLPIFPSEKEWLARSPDERNRLLAEILAVVAEHRASTTERWCLDDELSEGQQRNAHSTIAQARAMIARSDARLAQAEADPAKARAEKADLAISGLQTGILAALESRGIVIEDELRARVLSCDDPMILQRWLLRALSASSAAEALSADDATQAPS
jgi:hypothetical protein